MEGWENSLTPPLFIEVPVPIQDSKRSCLCVLLLGMSVLLSVMSHQKEKVNDTKGIIRSCKSK